MPDVAAVLRDGKIVADPADVIAAANASGLPLPALAAKLLRESYGGRNVFGNDRVAYPTSGAYTAATEAVTRPAVDAYLRWRGKAGANRGRQNGVGPSQLTWAELQDQAEAEGGLHVPRVNMTVGARELARCLKAGGGSWREAGARYNGGRAYGDPKTTEAAREYGRWLEDAVADWSRRLSGIAVPTVPTSSNGGGGRRTLKRGDNGADVADLQRVLARWYPDLHLAADGDYGPATEGAVRRLQAGSRPPLTVDGIAGRQVYGALGMS